MEKFDLSAAVRTDRELSLKEKITVVYRLSLPGILAQITEILMQYIDAAMVGSLGAGATAAIGLVSSSTWLFGGIIMAAAAGFSVQVAHAVGAGDRNRAVSLFRQSLLSTSLLSALLACIGVMLAFRLPAWLGAEQSIWSDATAYFLFFALFIPVRQINSLCMNMLQCTGNMKVPSIVASMMCVLDMIFNFFLIFPSRTVSFFGIEFAVWGAGLGVKGAQYGTSLSILVSAVILLYYAACRSEILALRHHKSSWKAPKEVIQRALEIGVPMAMQSGAINLASIVTTKIIAPLGTVAIAANSIGVTAESICYMPGFGIASASTTLVGQAYGAKNKNLARSFAWLTTFSGMAAMSVLGIIMYFLCPYVFTFMTPSQEVRTLAAEVLRIELLAEPLFAASIVATGALRGAGDTLVPGLMNLFSVWVVRVLPAWFLAPRIGLKGMWIAMAMELCFRGAILLFRLKQEKWLKKISD